MDKNAKKNLLITGLGVGAVVLLKDYVLLMHDFRKLLEKNELTKRSLHRTLEYVMDLKRRPEDDEELTDQYVIDMEFYSIMDEGN